MTSSDKPWRAYRVLAVDVHDEPDGLARVNVFTAPVPDRSPKSTPVFEFMVGSEDRRIPSQRFQSFLAACGIQERVDDTREIDGRYFAARDNGRSVTDFGPLENAFRPVTALAG
ncbi:MAG: hypothetical protein K5872_08940 [Rhizobiaceae bacterium]|nr:hypothetical protein [Rhizobiaceae bacterium]MCV0406341.1 hypothetical protein [Rhizobiaceae bacterium]